MGTLEGPALVAVDEVVLVAVARGELPQRAQIGGCVLVRVQVLTANGNLDDLELGTGRSERRPRLS